MEIQDLKMSGYEFELENKKVAFKMITWNDAIKAQNAIHLLATNMPANIDEGNKRLLDLALKYAIIPESNLENMSAEIFSTQFENLLSLVELSAQFRDFILGFLDKLPSFQKVQLVTM